MSTRKPSGSDAMKCGVAEGTTKRTLSDLSTAPTVAVNNAAVSSDGRFARGVDFHADDLAEHGAEGYAGGAAGEGGDDDDGKHRHRQGEAVGLAGHDGSFGGGAI